MKTSRPDSAIAILTATAAVTLCCCLMVLWHVAFDASGRTTLVVLSATMLAISLTVPLPGMIVRMVRRVGRWFGLQDPLAGLLGSPGPSRSRPDDARALIRLLSLSLAAMAVGGLISMAAVALGGMMARRASGTMLFSPWSWATFELLVAMVGMIPFAAGAAMAFLVTTMVRAGSGHDAYATVLREWLFGISGGLAVFAACWHWGLDIRGLAGVTIVLLLAAAAGIYQRREIAAQRTKPRRILETPSAGQAIAVAGAFGLMSLGLLVQLRLAGDVFGVGPAVGAAWLAGSVALLGWFGRTADRKSKPPSRTQQAGAVAGATAGLGLQGALLLAAVASDRSAAIAMCIAGAFQIPIVALCAISVSRQRRQFALAGGRARQYVALAWLGAGLAVLGYQGVASLGFGPVAILIVGLALFVAWICVGIALAPKTDMQVQWAVHGAILLCALSIAILGSVRQLTGRFTHFRHGVWLTSCREKGESSWPGRYGVLPTGGTAKSPVIDDVLAELLDAFEGRWLAAVGSRADLPERIGPNTRLRFCPPDPTCARFDGLPSVADEGMFSLVQRGRERFEGVLIAPLPADHPQGWRCYNRDTLELLADKLQPGGIAVLRLRFADGSVGAALAAAGTFHRTVGPCWVVVQDGGDDADDVDLLFIGPSDRVTRPAARPGMIVLTSRQFWYEWRRPQPIRLLGGARTAESGPPLRRFLKHLRRN